jgi:hypothetical protein
MLRQTLKQALTDNYFNIETVATVWLIQLASVAQRHAETDAETGTEAHTDNYG